MGVFHVRRRQCNRFINSRILIIWLAIIQPSLKLLPIQSWGGLSNLTTRIHQLCFANPITTIEIKSNHNFINRIKRNRFVGYCDVVEIDYFSGCNKHIGLSTITLGCAPSSKIGIIIEITRCQGGFIPRLCLTFHIITQSVGNIRHRNFSRIAYYRCVSVRCVR